MIDQLIKMCAWNHPKFLIFSSNVFDPLIYYSHFIPLAAAIIIGVFVFSRNSKTVLNRALLAIMSGFAVWTIADLILWATDDPRKTMFFWSLQIIVEPLIYAACWYFCQIVYGGGPDISLKKKIAAALPLLPPMLFASTRLAIVGFNLSNCNRDAVEGPLAWYGYAIELAYLLWIAAAATKTAKNANDRTDRHRVIAIATGVCLFLLSLSWGNIIGSYTDDWRIGQWGLFGMPVFAAFLAFAIVRFQAFDIKLLAIRAFLVALPVAVLSPLLVKGLPAIHVVIVLISCAAVSAISIAISKINTALIAANQKLVEQERFESELLSIASHQLRGAFTTIVGYTKGIIDGDYGAISEQAAHATSVSFTTAAAAGSMIEEFLDVGRIRRGDLQYHFALCDLRKILKAVVDELRLNIAAKHLKLEVQISPGEYSLIGDASRLKQLMYILIDNAVRYTASGSISITLKQSSATFELIVKDTGIGITEDDKQRLFEKFGRGTRSTSINPSSSGLGLFLAANYVKAHRGAINAQSSGVNGSQFSVQLPITQRDTDSSKQTSTGSGIQ